jgi:aspartate-semialdehyde dehydrogenase
LSPVKTKSGKIPVVILGATGVVGQRFLRHLADHPLFELAYLAASERSAGKLYKDACVWHLDSEPFAGKGDMTVVACSPESAPAAIAFSALDADVAKVVEPRFAEAGILVFSNASSFRMDADVPLLIPEINAEHLKLLETQKKNRGWKGGIITNPNCTTVMLASALSPLERAFGIESVLVTSMQAISGAGYPGVSAMDIVGNVVPYIKNEEPKVESESNKILGSVKIENSFAVLEPGPFTVSATCTRVPVLEGHTLSVSVKLKGNPSVEQVRHAIEAFLPDTAPYSLHSAPERFLVVTDVIDRPQPRLDVETDGGMRVTVGRIRPCPIMGIKFVVIGHNTERGAAGASVLNAELAYAKGFLR